MKMQSQPQEFEEIKDHQVVFEEVRDHRACSFDPFHIELQKVRDAIEAACTPGAERIIEY